MIISAYPQRAAEILIFKKKTLAIPIAKADLKTAGDGAVTFSDT